MKEKAVLFISLLFLAAVSSPVLAEVKWVNEGPAEPVRGVEHITFFSSAVGEEVGFVIYTPPGYKASDEHYPVIYFLHGISGNEWSYYNWFKYNGGIHHSVNLISLIESGQVPPTIIVFPNGGAGSGYKEEAEEMLISELIPFVDFHWRTVASPQGRGLEGFSMGGAGSCRFAWRYPYLFLLGDSPGRGGNHRP